MAEYCCGFLGIFYCCYGTSIFIGICKEEYKERLIRNKRIREEYNRFTDINYETELSNITFSNLESKLSTITEEDDDELY